MIKFEFLVELIDGVSPLRCYTLLLNLDDDLVHSQSSAGSPYLLAILLPFPPDAPASSSQLKILISFALLFLFTPA